jgi:hypothetical protein
VLVVTLIEKAQPPLCLFSNVTEKLCRRQRKGSNRDEVSGFYQLLWEGNLASVGNNIWWNTGVKRIMKIQKKTKNEEQAQQFAEADLAFGLMSSMVCSSIKD